MNKINIKIQRDERLEEYTVPIIEGMVVLDALIYIQENIDPTLAFRWNCKAAHCGSCSAEINNIPKLMCKTRLDSIGKDIIIKPMGVYPKVKDLVSDISANWEIAKRITPFNPKKQNGIWKMYDIDVDRSQEFKKCIECFLCMDVCHVISHKKNYIGPRYVIKTAERDLHPMDIVNRSKELTEENGLGYCNVTKCCQEVCPSKIKITDNAIIPEKEREVNANSPISKIIERIRKELK